MGILGGIIGRREPIAVYRTVDGGHPAPYPDMTDEQLYNYEIAFNVPNRTFTHPPAPHRPPSEAAARPAQPAPHIRPEPSLGDPPREILREAPRFSIDGGGQEDGQRLRRNKAFDAPRYTARKGPAPSAAPIDAKSSPVIDFTKPVRLITSKQPVDIITTRARHPVYKVHAYIGDDDVVTVFTLQGQLSENGPRFLENAPQVQQLHLNIYLNGAQDSGDRYRITQHETRADAEAAAEPERLTCVAVRLGE